MSQQPSAAPAETPLERALGQNEAVKDTVEQSAAELLVINAVLKQEVPPHIQTGEVAQALQKTDELETRIQESAEDLAQVNQTLEQEIGERADLERELARTKAALAKATGQPRPAKPSARRGDAPAVTRRSSPRHQFVRVST
jgi:C4-dicarboxylate-specific signal transduction histidine kinase